MNYGSVNHPLGVLSQFIGLMAVETPMSSISTRTKAGARRRALMVSKQSSSCHSETTKLCSKHKEIGRMALGLSMRRCQRLESLARDRLRRNFASLSAYRNDKSLSLETRKHFFAPQKIISITHLKTYATRSTQLWCRQISVDQAEGQQAMNWV